MCSDIVSVGFRKKNECVRIAWEWEIREDAFVGPYSLSMAGFSLHGSLGPDSLRM